MAPHFRQTHLHILTLPPKPELTQKILRVLKVAWSLSVTIWTAYKFQRPDLIQATSFSNKTKTWTKREWTLFGSTDKDRTHDADVTFKGGAARCQLPAGFSFYCSGEAFVGIIILESMCWMSGTGKRWVKKPFFEAQKVTNSTKNFVKFSVAQLWVYKKTYCAHLCNTPPRASLPAATQRSSCLLGTEGPCKL